jgi:uncharacterized protein
VWRAIDFHVHPPVREWLEGSMSGYMESAEYVFHTKPASRSLGELSDMYASLGVGAVLLGWDAETATGRPALDNAVIAEACQRFPDVFMGFGSIDPHKPTARAELERIKSLGLSGVKFHPSLQAFAPDEPQYDYLFEVCEQLGLIALFHTGTVAIGAHLPGGLGIRLDYSRPIRLDAVAAAHSGLTIVAAHFGWPWHAELIAMAMHKSNIYIDISGWAPRLIPEEVVDNMKGRLQDQFLFATDYPFIDPGRALRGLERLKLPDDVIDKVTIDNARRILGLTTGDDGR